MKRRASAGPRQKPDTESLKVQEAPRRRRKALTKGTDQPSSNRPAAAVSDGLPRCGWAEMYKGAAAADYIR
jgi:hypothetical protein